MFAIIGIIVLLVMIFGGFALSGGALGPVMGAMPFEMLIIAGAAIGAMVTGNSGQFEGDLQGLRQDIQGA